MALQTRIGNGLAIAMVNVVDDEMSGGAAAPFLRVFDGTQPAGADVAVSTQKFGVSATLPDPAFGGATDGAPGGLITANTIVSAIITSTITATWFRVFDSDSSAILDGSAGTASTDMILNTVALVTSAIMAFTSWTITMPES